MRPPNTPPCSHPGTAGGEELDENTCRKLRRPDREARRGLRAVHIERMTRGGSSVQFLESPRRGLAPSLDRHAANRTRIDGAALGADGAAAPAADAAAAHQQLLCSPRHAVELGEHCCAHCCPASRPFTCDNAAPHAQGVVVVPQQFAWVVERFGKFHSVLEPGLNFLVPGMHRIRYVYSLKEEALSVPSQVPLRPPRAASTARPRHSKRRERCRVSFSSDAALPRSDCDHAGQCQHLDRRSALREGRRRVQGGVRRGRPALRHHAARACAAAPRLGRRSRDACR
eukprot:647769-Prymnesium_polylepis.1